MKPELSRSLAVAILKKYIALKETISPIEDFKFSHDSSCGADTQGVRIDKYLGTSLRVCIPEKIEGAPVTAIGKFAFCETGIMEVVIPDSVTTIGNLAFKGCTGLSEETKQRILSINPEAVFD